MLRIACYVIAVVVFLSIQAEGAVSRGRANSTTTTDSAGEFWSSIEGSNLATSHLILQATVLHDDSVFIEGTNMKWAQNGVIHFLTVSIVNVLHLDGPVVGMSLVWDTDIIHFIVSIRQFLFRYGIKAGVFPTPPGCQPVPNTCEVKFVKESDPSQDCNSTA